MVWWAMMAVAQMQPVTEPAGVPVELMVMTEVSTARARAGDLVKLRVHRPVEQDGVTLVPEGAAAFGEVLRVRPGGMAMKKGALAIRLTRVVVNGRDMPLDGILDTKGRGGKGDGVAKVILAPFYAPFAPGNSARFKAGEIITGRLIAPPPLP